MKRLMAIGFACAISTVAAMPTRKDLAKAHDMVKDVTSADVKALKAGTKKPAEVAAAHMELAGKSESEAEKYLLLQGTFNLYAKTGDYDSAANALEAMCRDIAVSIEKVSGQGRRTVGGSRFFMGSGGTDAP